MASGTWSSCRQPEPVGESESTFIERACLETFGFRLEPGAWSRIERFLDLLVVWNQRLHLTGERGRQTLLRKHVVDSLSCVPLLPLQGRALDLGTGAGFPGAVLACVRPELDMTLLDARRKPVSFLHEVARHVPLPHATAIAMRAEEAGSSPGLSRSQMLVTSRALRMDVFLPLARPLLAAGGSAVSMQTPKRNRSAAEIIVRAHGFDLVELRDYRLPDGEPRRLVVMQ